MCIFMTNLIKFSGVQAHTTPSLDVSRMDRNYFAIIVLPIYGVDRNYFVNIVLPIYGVDRNYFVNIVFQMHPIVLNRLVQFNVIRRYVKTNSIHTTHRLNALAAPPGIRV